MQLSDAFSPSRALSHGFAALKRAPAGMLLGGTLMFFIGICSGGGGGGGDLDRITEGQSPEVSAALGLFMLGLLAVGLVLALLGFLARCFLQPGWIRYQRNLLQTGEDRPGLLFSGGDALLPMVGWSLLDGVIRYGTFAVASIPGAAVFGYAWMSTGGDVLGKGLVFTVAGAVLVALLAGPVLVYVDLGLRFGALAVALEGRGPVAALEQSWGLARGNRIQLFVFFVVVGLFSLLGFLFCLIGYPVTRAIADLGTTEAYLLATVPEARDWTLPREEGV